MQIRFPQNHISIRLMIKNANFKKVRKLTPLFSYDTYINIRSSSQIKLYIITQLIIATTTTIIIKFLCNDF